MGNPRPITVALEVLHEGAARRFSDLFADLCLSLTPFALARASFPIPEPLPPSLIP